MGKGTTDLVEGSTRSGGDVEHPQRRRTAIGKMLEAPFQRCQHPSAHCISGSIEQNFDLEVVETCGVVAEISIGLMMEILQVVVGKQAAIGVLGEIANVALLAAIPGGRQVKPDQGIAAGPVQPGSIKQLGFWIGALLRFIPVAFLQLSHGAAQVLQQVRGDALGAGNGVRGQQLHQLGAQLLVGQTCDSLALLQGLVGQLAEGRSRHSIDALSSHSSECVAKPRHP